MMTVIGTRPEIIKMSPLIPLFDSEFSHLLVHSGQHYSPSMDSVFFEELKLRKPDYVLESGGLPPADQTGAIMRGVEKIILAEKPSAVTVHGDTNTTLAAALAAAKHREHVKAIIHIEAGVRSFNRTQPEELNRVLVDQAADILFIPYEHDRENALREGIPDNRIFVTNGNTVLESAIRTASIADSAAICGKYSVTPRNFAIATFHRQESVDSPEILSGICRAMTEISDLIPLIIPLHPRTEKRISEFGIKLEGSRLMPVPPIGYIDMTGLLQNARFCMTDSGGLQEEAAALGTPALVLRNETEHIRYLKSGLHRLTGIQTETIVREARRLIDKKPDTQSIEIKSGISVSILEAIVNFLK